jgi:twitching motility protein PilT
MPRLDPFIQALFKDAGDELVFESGAGAFVKTSRGKRAVIQQPLTTAQIMAVLVEIVPPELKKGFPREGTTAFAYTAPAGAVAVTLEKKAVKARVVIVRSTQEEAEDELGEDDGEGQFELGTPAEMMQMAMQAAAASVDAPPGDPMPPLEPAPEEVGDIKVNRVKRGPKLPPPPAPAAQPAAAPAARGGSEPGAYLSSLIELMIDQGASDLHLASKNPPMLRKDGDMIAIEGQPVLTHDRLKSMLWTIVPERNKKQWEEVKDTDYAHETARARFRCNVYADRHGIGSVMRQIPTQIRPAEDMGLSKHILDLCFLTKGLVLCTGPTGSGKSTTLASMVDYCNRHREDHIITIEDPIEFVHENKKCLVNQREVGVHTNGFKPALRAALREDPDVVLVGELRDLETMAIAIETAETGHLVFGTLHTNSAPSTVDRIIDQFPTDRQEQIRMMLSESLKAVITQVLCKKIGGGRIAAMEVLMVQSGVANLIREGKTFQIPSIMQTGKAQGNVNMSDALLELVKKKLVEPREAYAKAVAKVEFKTSLERAGFKLDLAPNELVG